MKFSLKAAALILTAFFIFAGCSSGVISDTAEPPGGDPNLTQDINLKSLQIETQGEKTVIQMDFISGSRIAGVDETKLSSVPVYEISVTNTPYRIKIDMPVQYFDCFEYGNEIFNEGIVYGAFPCVGQNGSSVYIQLSQNVSVTAKEEGAVLTLELTPIAENTGSAYYAGFDLFEEYENGKIPSDIELSPSLDENRTEVILISKSFRDEQGADEFAESAISQLSENGIATESRVFELENSELPPSVAPAEASEAIQSNAVIEIGGDYNKLPILIENGRYLCETRDGEIIYSRLVTPDFTQDNEYVIKEELWKTDGAGLDEKIETGDFYGIEQAELSPDGRYLAILDSGITDKVLYVYDLEENALRNLGEEGLGAKTASFVWDDNEPVIYAMTGYNTFQLNRYDFSESGDNSITSVEEKPGADTKVVLIDGMLYFADPNAGESGEIYRLDPADPQREKIGEGKGFAVSPGGYYLAALKENPLDEMSVICSLDLIDLQSPGAQKHIIDDVESYAFGVDNDTLYYITQNDDGTNGRYQYAFKKYTVSTGETTLLGYTKTNMFVPTDEVGKVYIIDYIMRGNDGLYITYLFDENAA